MPDRNRLDGYLYHMVHFDNLQNIFQRRALLSKERVFQEGISYRSIAYEEVQSRRDRIYIWDPFKSRWRSLHSYVPFYFVTRTPMLYVQLKRGIQDSIVFFEASRSALNDRGVLFTDGNATNQQLSNYAAEEVKIIPASSLQDACVRHYVPTGPHGTNTNRSNFYCNIACLELLRWDIINGQRFDEEEKKRIKHAEVLVPDLFPLGKVQEICVKSQEMVRAVNALIVENGLVGRIPLATFKPQLFFQDDTYRR